MVFRPFSIITLTIVCMFRPLTAGAQDLDRMIDEYIRKASERKRIDVRLESGLPDAKLPGGGVRWSGPGMVYVEGLIAPDGATAIRLFRLVTDSLGADHWKEDALARMYEDYSRMGRRVETYEIPGARRGNPRDATYLTAGHQERMLAAMDTAAVPDSAGRIVAVYAIQVGAFSVAENAEKLSNLLASNGFPTVIHDNLIDGKRLLHLVWAGRYDTREEALPGLDRIEKLTGLRGVLREQIIWRRW